MRGLVRSRVVAQLLVRTTWLTPAFSACSRTFNVPSIALCRISVSDIGYGCAHDRYGVPVQYKDTLAEALTVTCFEVEREV